MKRFSICLAGLAVAMLISCNNIGRKDEVLAHVGKSDLMRSEFDFALASGSGGRGADPEVRKMVFQTLFEARIFAQAAKALVPQADAESRAKLSDMQDRDLAFIFQRFYLFENAGHTDDQVFAWFRKHESEFKKDTTPPDFDALRDSIVRRMTIEEHPKELQEYFDKTKAAYAGRDSADLGMLVARDSLALSKAVEAVQVGARFDSVAQAILTDSSLSARKGHLGMVGAGTYQPEFAMPGMALVQNSFFDRKQRLSTKTFTPVTSFMAHNGKDSSKVFVAMVAFSIKEAKEPTLEEVRTRIELPFLADYRQNLSKTALPDLKIKYKLETMPIPLPDEKSYYEAHKDEFQTQATWHLLHIEGADSAKLAQLAAGIKTEADFRAKAKASSENALTRDKEGDLGVVKAAHCLPSGLGMLPDLFTALDGRAAGFMTRVMKAPDSGKWELFWILEATPPQAKPLDRALVQVREKLKGNGEVKVDSSFVLVKVNGMPAIRESDVLKLREEVPAQQRGYYTRDKLLDVMVQWVVTSREAKALKLDQNWRFKALCTLREADTWAQVFRDSVMNRTLGYKDAELRKAFAENPAKVFDGRPFEKAVLDAALWLDIPAQSYQREFTLHASTYPGAADWQSVKAQIFPHIKDSELRAAQERLRARIRKDVGVEILDTLFAKYDVVAIPSIMGEAKKLYDARRLGDARNLYQKVLDLYPTDSSAFRANLMIAQTFNEEERYQQALDEYSVLAALWPAHPETYKALFMKGFIQSENLKQDTLALKSFQDLVAKYPKCDLADDAEWMIRNIKSGGKLAPALLDSIAKQDSAQAKKAKTEAK